MTPDAYTAAPACRHCGGRVHPGAWACAIGAALLNGGFQALIALLRPPAHDELPEA